MKTAVIMAAGMGTRFGKLTDQQPKGFILFKDKPMILRSIDTLLDCGIERIIIGTGYHKEAYEALCASYPQIECVFSPHYAETNSMYTLYNCREAIGDDDFLLLESDLVYDKEAINGLIQCPYDSAMLITSVRKFQDQYYVEMNEREELVRCSTNKSELHPSGELVGIHKISNSFYKLMVEDYESKVSSQPKLGYEYELLAISQSRKPLHVLKNDKCTWYEIDDTEDLNYAETHINIE